MTLIDAWKLYDQLVSDPRVGPFVTEPPLVEDQWRVNTARTTFSPKIWNDDYLAALTQTVNLELVTFDQGFSQYGTVKATILR